MQSNLPKRITLGIFTLMLSFICEYSFAGTLNDLESASVNSESEFQTAALQPLPRLSPPSSKNEILYPKLFGSKEIKSANLSIFPKWTSVLARYASQKNMLEESCTPTRDNPCPVTEWVKFLKSIQHKNVIEKLDAVNNYMNKVKYVTDNKNWNVNDFWVTPMEFLQRGGDCEDYAIAKFISLSLIGIPNEAMRIVIVNDENIRAIHAVLVVYINGKSYILDNQIKQMVAAESIHHYKPIYSINEGAWWRHRIA